MNTWIGLPTRLAACLLAAPAVGATTTTAETAKTAAAHYEALKRGRSLAKLKALKAEPPTVVKAVVAKLIEQAKSPDAKPAVEALQTLTKDPNPNIRAAATEAIGKITAEPKDAPEAP